MIKRTLQQIAAMVGGVIAKGSDHLLIQGVSTDSRSVQKSNLFIPIVGERFDGHDHVQKATESGAAAALWQSDKGMPPEGCGIILVEDTLKALQRLAHEYRKSLPVRVIGITGSNGKTTTKDLTASILETTYQVHKTSGNLNNHIGLPLTLLQMTEQTEIAVIEMGMSGAGEIALLTQLAMPEIAIITNIGEAHLLQLANREGIAKAKLEILSGLAPGGLFIYHGDEPLLKQQLPFAEKPAEMLHYRFGMSADNDLYPTAMMQIAHGTHFHINLPDSSNYYIPLLGKHNVVNALSAIAVAKYMGVHEQDVILGLKQVTLSGMRIERVVTNQGVLVLNDAYNASPTSTRAAIDLLQELKGYKRKVIVLGDMLELGPDEEAFHREIGQMLSPDELDYVFTYGTLSEYIAMEAQQRFPEGRVHVFQDKAQLIHALHAIVEANDVVLVKGSRGMRLEEVVIALQNN